MEYRCTIRNKTTGKEETSTFTARDEMHLKNVIQEQGAELLEILWTDESDSASVPSPQPTPTTTNPAQTHSHVSLADSVRARLAIVRIAIYVINFLVAGFLCWSINAPFPVWIVLLLVAGGVSWITSTVVDWMRVVVDCLDKQ